MWPAILVLAVAAYVFAWMRVSVRPGARTGEDEGALLPLLRRFAPRAAILLVAFALCGPWIARSETLLDAGAATARAAAFILTAVGLAAAATGNVLATTRGAFIVTPECLATALFPLYVAGILTVRMTWPARALALLAAPPLFTALAIVRLLLLALPPPWPPRPCSSSTDSISWCWAWSLWFSSPAGARPRARADGCEPVLARAPPWVWRR